MNAAVVLVLLFGIGVIAGLRAMTAPAVVAWAARLGWLSLAGTGLAFMGSTWAVVIFTVAAVGEFVTDQLPKTPPRTVPVQLVARIVSGGFSAACLSVAAGGSPLIGALVGGVGAVAGTYGGYHARVGLVHALHVPDRAIAVPEDLIAIGTGLLVVSRM